MISAIIAGNREILFPKLDNNQIYNLVKTNLDTFYYSYNGIPIGLEDYKQIALEEIDELKKNNNSSNFMNELINRINERIEIEKKINSNPNYKNFLTDIKKYPVLSKEETYSLIKKAQNGDEEAKQKLVRHNLKLVVYIPKLLLNHLLLYHHKQNILILFSRYYLLKNI